LYCIEATIEGKTLSRFNLKVTGGGFEREKHQKELSIKENMIFNHLLIVSD